MNNAAAAGTPAGNRLRPIVARASEIRVIDDKDRNADQPETALPCHGHDDGPKLYYCTSWDEGKRRWSWAVRLTLPWFVGGQNAQHMVYGQKGARLKTMCPGCELAECFKEPGVVSLGHVLIRRARDALNSRSTKFLERRREDATRPRVMGLG